MTDAARSLQETYAPNNACFGCGPANPKGLRIRSFEKVGEEGTVLVCDWTPSPHHEAFEGVLNGGILGAILDCHMNWTTIVHLMKANGLDHAPCCVTADFKVTLKRPTPSKEPLRIESRVVTSAADRCTITATITSGGKVTALGDGTFVAVKPDHPAFHRW